MFKKKKNRKVRGTIIVLILLMTVSLGHMSELANVPQPGSMPTVVALPVPTP